MPAETIIELSTMSSQDGYVLFGEDVNDHFGAYVSNADDINGDGVDDIIVGAPSGSSDGGELPATGTAYVIFGKEGATRAE